MPVTIISSFSHEEKSAFPNLSCNSTAVILLEMGKKLFALGHYEKAMHMFEYSYLALSSPSEATQNALLKQEEWNGQKLASVSDPFLQPPVDTFMALESMVDPRPFNTPLVSQHHHNDSTSFEFLQLIIFYNKALTHHAMNQFSLASNCYQLIIAAINQMALSNGCLVSDECLHLAMFVYNNLGHISFCQQAEDVACVYFETSLRFAERIKNSPALNPLDVANVQSNWCRAKYMKVDICGTVYDTLETILHIRSSALDCNHPDVASSHFNLGVAEFLRNNYSKAMLHLMEYLKVATSHQRKNVSTHADLDPLLGAIYVIMIKNSRKNDKVSMDLISCLKALQKKRHKKGAESEVASILNSIGTILFHQQELDYALLFYQEELLLEKEYMPSGKEYGISVTCNNIGRILQELGRLPEAMQYYHMALQERYGDALLNELDGCLGISKDYCTDTLKNISNEPFSDPPAAVNLFSTVFYNLGLIYDKMESTAKAIKAFEMSLRLRKVILGPDHADVACLAYNVGVLQLEQKMLKEATLSFREALRIRRVASNNQLNDCHMIKTLHKLASLHRAKGNLNDALEACQDILEILKTSGEINRACRKRDIALTLRQLAELYHAKGSLKLALQMAFRSVKLLQKCRDSCLVEQEAVSLLLVGSLQHELCEQVKARNTFSEAAHLIQSSSCKLPQSLLPLLEVSILLRSEHCAPEA